MNSIGNLLRSNTCSKSRANSSCLLSLSCFIQVIRDKYIDDVFVWYWFKCVKQDMKSGIGKDLNSLV